MKVLVIGGQSRAADAFRRYACETHAFDLRVASRLPEMGRFGEELVRVEDYFAAPASLFAGTDAAVNFTGIVRGTHAEFETVNVEGPARLAVAARAAGVKHFVHISSLAVYGRAEDIRYDTPISPVGPYGASKAAGDAKLSRLAERDFKTTILRVPVLYSRTVGGKLGQLARAMKLLGVFPVPPRLSQRSVLHMDNLAVAIRRVLEGGLGGVRFAADPQPFTLRDMAEAVTRCGYQVKLIECPGVFFVPLRTAVPALYASVYGESLIYDQGIEEGSAPWKYSLAQGLADLVG